MKEQRSTLRVCIICIVFIFKIEVKKEVLESFEEKRKNARN